MSLYRQTCVLLSISFGCVILSSAFISMKNYINDMYNFWANLDFLKIDAFQFLKMKLHN